MALNNAFINNGFSLVMLWLSLYWLMIICPQLVSPTVISADEESLVVVARIQWTFSAYYMTHTYTLHPNRLTCIKLNDYMTEYRSPSKNLIKSNDEY